MGKAIQEAIIDLKEIVAKLSSKGGIYTGIVKEINTDNYTCKVELNVNDEGNVTEGVFINAALEVTAGMIQVPELDSVVWVADMEGDMGVIKCSALNEFVVQVGDNATLRMKEGAISLDASGYTVHMSNGGKVELNGNVFGGLVKVMELVGKLNNLEYDLNTLKQIFIAWVIAPGDGGAALKALAASWAADPLTASTDTELKNENVTHG